MEFQYKSRQERIQTRRDETRPILLVFDVGPALLLLFERVLTPERTGDYKKRDEREIHSLLETRRS